MPAPSQWQRWRHLPGLQRIEDRRRNTSALCRQPIQVAHIAATLATGPVDGALFGQVAEELSPFQVAHQLPGFRFRVDEDRLCEAFDIQARVSDIAVHFLRGDLQIPVQIPLAEKAEHAVLNLTLYLGKQLGRLRQALLPRLQLHQLAVDQRLQVVGASLLSGLCRAQSRGQGQHETPKILYRDQLAINLRNGVAVIATGYKSKGDGKAVEQFSWYLHLSSLMLF